MAKFQNVHKAAFWSADSNLAWAKDVPLFVAGRLAGLRIGPDCGNLEDARVSAERISWAVEEILDKQQDNGSDTEDFNQSLFQRMRSINIYESLEEQT